MWPSLVLRSALSSPCAHPGPIPTIHTNVPKDPGKSSLHRLCHISSKLGKPDLPLSAPVPGQNLRSFDLLQSVTAWPSSWACSASRHPEQQLLPRSPFISRMKMEAAKAPLALLALDCFNRGPSLPASQPVQCSCLPYCLLPHCPQAISKNPLVPGRRGQKLGSFPAAPSQQRSVFGKIISCCHQEEAEGRQ